MNEVFHFVYLVIIFFFLLHLFTRYIYGKQFKSSPFVCLVIDHEFRHNIVKIAVDPRGDRLLTMKTSQ